MAKARFSGLEQASQHKPIDFVNPFTKSSEYYGSHVFNQKAMREYMSKEAYESVLNAIEKGNKIDREIADQVATAMKAWSISKAHPTTPTGSSH